MKRGIVLEGGGAKGAYQVGALRALMDAGVAIHAMAGTSVGGLNGTLLTYSALDEGESYWRSLGLHSVAKPRWTWLPLAPLFLLNVMSYKFRASQALPPLSARNFRLTLTYFLFITALVPASALIEAEPQTEPVPLWQGVAYLASFYAVILALWAAFSLLRRARFSLLEPGPIREFLERIVGDRPPNIPAYVTLTYERRAFDPDSPRLFFGKYDDVPVWGAVEDEYPFPAYFHLNSLTPGDRIAATIASAALPVGIFPSVRLDGVAYVDGGVSDNLPLYPLVEFEQCDEVIVVAMRPWTRDSLRKHWQQVDRRVRLGELDEQIAQDLYFEELDRRGGDRRHAEKFETPVNLPLREPSSWPERVVLVCPSRPLGGFITGTLRFSRRYANRLMDAGYEDAKNALALAGPDGS